MLDQDIIGKFKDIVYEYAKAHLDVTDFGTSRFVPGDVYVVWQVKVLQNWKALLSTALQDGMYYELTYNGDAHEIYLDAYKKFENVVIAQPPPPAAEEKLTGPPFDFSLKGDIAPGWAATDRREEKEGF